MDTARPSGKITCGPGTFADHGAISQFRSKLRPADEPVGEFNLITVDLSPVRNGPDVLRPVVQSISYVTSIVPKRPTSLHVLKKTSRSLTETFITAAPGGMPPPPAWSQKTQGPPTLFPAALK